MAAFDPEWTVNVSVMPIFRLLRSHVRGREELLDWMAKFLLRCTSRSQNSA